MTFRQIFLSLKKSKLLLLLLIVFFLKQLFIVAIFPIFQGPDETIHYSRIQYLAEPKEKTWEMKMHEKTKGKNDISTFNYSEELINTAELSEFDKIAFHSSSTNIFSNSSQGLNEKTIKESDWKKYIENSGVNLKKETIAYYFIPSLIEKLFSGSDIFTRFFLERIFSAILGILIILLTYFSARKIGFDEKISIMLSTLIAFQPMFSQSSAIINYDIMLIFVFSLFAYGAVSSVKEEICWKNSLIMVVAIILGLLTKMPSIILIIISFFLFVYFLQKKLKIERTKSVFGSIISFFILAIAFISIFQNYTQLFFKKLSSLKFNSISESIFSYIETTKARWEWSELSYWGNFGWLDAGIPSWIVNIAHWIEIAAILGVIAYFIFPKKIPEFLPKRKFVVLLIGLFAGLEFIIRFADWIYFNSSGEVQLGTPGRYFLPVVFAQFSLIIIGLGMLARKYSIWKNTLKVLALSMIILWTYATLIVIIPRYYL